ncbi:MAG: hypothetical protein AAGA35_03535 [Patescibacteria group bacterium]
MHGVGTAIIVVEIIGTMSVPLLLQAGLVLSLLITIGLWVCLIATVMFRDDEYLKALTRKFILTEYGRIELEDLISALSIEVESLNRQLVEHKLPHNTETSINDRLVVAKKRYVWLKYFHKVFMKKEKTKK